MPIKVLQRKLIHCRRIEKNERKIARSIGSRKFIYKKYGASCNEINLINFLVHGSATIIITLISIYYSTRPITLRVA